MYGNIRDIHPDIVMVSSFFLLYICRKPIRTTKYVNNGVIPLTELSAALNTTCENSGVRELCIYIGTIIGDIIAHLVAVAGTRNDDISVRKNVINTSTIPVGSRLLSQLVRLDNKNTPRFVSLNIKQN